jgi:FKBP12-rapamycin complex-associated protein
MDRTKNKTLTIDKNEWNDAALNKLLTELKNKNPEIRRKAGKKFKNHVAGRAREMSGESFSKFMNELTNKHIFELVNSSVVAEKIGGILAIDKLIDIEHDENVKTTRFANYLRIGLQSNDITVMVMASKALWRLAQASGTLTAVFVESEVKRALEWLQDAPSRRHAAVLVLKELAENAPTLFYVHVVAFFDLVWAALNDNSLHTREAAVEALRAALAVISERENRLRVQWYHKIYEEANKGLKQNVPSTIHGSLLALGELLRNTGEFMYTRYKDVCDTILRQRAHRDRLVKRTVISLFSRLAQFLPEEFVNNYLTTCLQTLLNSLRKERPEERSVAFIALGEIAIVWAFGFFYFFIF